MSFSVPLPEDAAIRVGAPQHVPHTKNINAAVKEIRGKVGVPDGVASLDGDGLLPESQVPERLTEENLTATIDAALAVYTVYVDSYETVGEAYAALAAAGGGVLQFTRGVTYTDVALVLDQVVPTLVLGYGATIKPPVSGDAITFAAGRSQNQPIAVQGLSIDCSGLSARGVVINDHYGAVLRDVRINAPTVGVLVTDTSGWSESSQLDNVYVKAATVAGFDFQTDGGTGSFGYASWGLVHADNIPGGAVGFRVGVDASVANSSFAQVVLHSSAASATGMQILGDAGYNTRIDAVIEALASSMAGSVGLELGSAGTLGGADFNLNILNPSGGGGWGTRISNPSTRPFQARTPRNRKIAAATNQAIEESGSLGDAQPMFSRSPDGTLRWGPGGSTATDTTLSRSGVGALLLAGALQINSGNLNPFGGMRLASAVTTTTGTMGTGNAPAALVDATSGAITRTLFNTTAPGYFYIVAKVDSSANTVTIAPPSGGTINGSGSSIVLHNQGDMVLLFSTPTSGAWIAKVL